MEERGGVDWETRRARIERCRTCMWMRHKQGCQCCTQMGKGLKYPNIGNAAIEEGMWNGADCLMYAPKRPSLLQRLAKGLGLA